MSHYSHNYPLDNIQRSAFHEFRLISVKILDVYDRNLSKLSLYLAVDLDESQKYSGLILMKILILDFDNKLFLSNYSLWLRLSHGQHRRTDFH